MAVPSGVSWKRSFRGLPFSQPRNSCELGLTHHDFQGAQGCAAGIQKIPWADFQRPALLRAKGCRLMTHRGAQFSASEVGVMAQFQGTDEDASVAFTGSK